MKTLEIFEALKVALQAIPLDAETAGDEPLFETVELAANRNLAKQFTELLALKSRVCLVVPLRIVRTVSEGGQLSVLGTKMAEVAIIYSDRSYFKPSQKTTFGSDKNLGLFATDEKIETELCGKALSPFGGTVPGDSDPITLSDGEQAALPGRTAWLMTIYVPIGIIATAVTYD